MTMLIGQGLADLNINLKISIGNSPMISFGVLRTKFFGFSVFPNLAAGRGYHRTSKNAI